MAKLKQVRALKSSGVEPLAPTLIKRIPHALILKGEDRRWASEIGRDHQSQFRACENCKRRRRTDAEDPRRAQKCVHSHWDEGGVKANADRKSRDGRIGHRLGQHDGRRRQAGNDIEAQCR
jgi:hypothetical protein